MSSLPTWGVVATIKAPARDILDFAAHHLDLGAHRVHVYLDAPNAQAEAALRDHPKCRVILCDEGYWRRRRKRAGRPETHQPRQSINATHCLNRRPQVDWLAHIDVDEFLWPETPLPAQLAALPDDCLSARVRPVEALAPDPGDPPPDGVTWFKSCARLPGQRRDETGAIYPGAGRHLNGGFLSHVAGKVFVRTGMAGTSLRIHNALRNGERDADPPELRGARLCHLHAPGWEEWHARLRYRHAAGAYRPGIRPAGEGALPIHDLLARIEAEGGAAGLRAFFTEVCTATPALRAALEAHGRLHAIPLDPAPARARHFPAWDARPD
jgi:hypothetical protein